MNHSKTIALAALAGLVGSGAIAQSVNAFNAAPSHIAADEKSSCKGHSGCEGKDKDKSSCKGHSGCEGKE